MSSGPPLHEKSALLKRYASVDAANVADVLDGLGLRNQSLDRNIVSVSTEQVVGFAFTLGGTPVTEGRPNPLKADACSRVTTGDVTVWSVGGSGAVLGETIAMALMERGCAGAVVWGGVRDVRWIRELNFPVFSSHVSPAQSRGRCEITSFGEPVSIAGLDDQPVVIHPGDLIFGDADGVVVVPADVVEEVLVEVERLTNHENEVRRRLRDGGAVSDAINQHQHVVAKRP